jgi:hypothetical protein
MSASHILRAVQPVAAGYILTSVDNLGTGQWTNPSSPSLSNSISYNDTMSGIWADPLPIQVNLQNNFNNTTCTMTVSGTTTAVSNTTSYIEFKSSLPAGFIPPISTDIYFTIPIVDNSAFTVGQLQIGSSGEVYILSSTSENFGGAGACGFGVFSVTWPLSLPAP